MSAADQNQSGGAPLRIGGGAVRLQLAAGDCRRTQGMFARRNLAIEIKRLGAVDKATAAVKSGELDLAITPPEGAIRDCVGGGNLRIIAGNVNRLPLSLIANPRIRRIRRSTWRAARHFVTDRRHRPVHHGGAAPARIELPGRL